MKHLTFCAALLAASTVLIGCKDDLDGGVNNGENIVEELDPVAKFSTSTTYQLSINYATKVEGAIVFEVYDQSPLKDGVKSDDLLPIFSGFTQKDGTFSQAVELPEYLSAPGRDVYVYTSAIHVPSLLKANVSNGSITVDANNLTKVASRSSRAGAGTTTALDKGWIAMGEYDENGTIQYADGFYEEEELRKDFNLFNSYYANRNGKNNNEQKDFVFKSDGEEKLAVTLLSSNSKYGSSLGYYYYKQNSKPSYNSLQIHMIFPNTQDGTYTTDDGEVITTVGTKVGTSVYLKYYENGVAQDAFPEGKWNIGFVLLSDAWSQLNDGNQTLSTTNTTYSITASGDEINNNGVANRPVIGFKYSDGKGLNSSGKIESAFFGFEDNFIPCKKDKDDVNNYKDVVIKLSVGSTEDIEAPWIDNITPETSARIQLETSGGLFSFEDLWPSRGDFDMNDVLVRYDYYIQYYETTYKDLLTEEVTDVEYKLDGEEFYLTPGQNVNAAGNKNGFGVCLKTAVKELKEGENCTITSEITKESVLDADGNFVYNDDYEYVPFEVAQSLHQEGVYGSSDTYNVILITDNIKGADVLNHRIRIKVKYNEAQPIEGGSRDGVSTLNPFIYKESTRNPGKRWEVHLTGRIPTAMVDDSYFGEEDDASDIEEGIFYVRKVQGEAKSSLDYPFSFYLLGVPNQDAYENLRNKLVRDKNGHVTGRPKNESVAIDQIFAGYKNWVESNHTEDKDWYLH